MAAAVLLQAGGDAVVLRSGERVEGDVLESSSSGVRLRLPNGAVRWFHPMAVERVERAGAPPPGAPGPVPSQPPARPPEPGFTPGPPPAMESDAPEAARTAQPVAEPSTGPPWPLGIWGAFAFGAAVPMGDSGRSSAPLSSLAGDAHLLISGELGLHVTERNSWGATLDITLGDAGSGLQPTCSRVGTDCSTSAAQLALFYRLDLAPAARWNPWVSLGAGREWLAGDVLNPYAGGGSVTVLTAQGWVGRLGGGVDLPGAQSGRVGLYVLGALGSYDSVSIGHVDVRGGAALHGWLQAGLRIRFGP